jgi:hypothetical protein
MQKKKGTFSKGRWKEKGDGKRKEERGSTCLRMSIFKTNWKFLS